MFRAAILISLCYCAAITKGRRKPAYPQLKILTEESVNTMKAVADLGDSFNWEGEDPKAFWLLDSGLMELMRRVRSNRLRLSRVIEVLPRAEYIFKVNIGTYTNPESVTAVRLIATNPMEGVLDWVSILVRRITRERRIYWDKWLLDFQPGYLYLIVPWGQQVRIVSVWRSLDRLLKHDSRFTEGDWDARVLAPSEMSSDPGVLKVKIEDSSYSRTAGKSFTAICRKCGTSYAVFAEVYNAMLIAGADVHRLSFKPRATISRLIRSVFQRSIQTKTLDSLKQAALEVALKRLSDLAYIWPHPLDQEEYKKRYYTVLHPIQRIYFNCARENGILFARGAVKEEGMLTIMEYPFSWSRAKLPTLLCKNFFVDPKNLHLIYYPASNAYTLDIKDAEKSLK